MIDEVFIKSAINIRRQYLKVTNNMEFYHNRAKEIVKTLEDSLDKLQKLQGEAKDDKTITLDKAVKEVEAIILDVEQEGVRLEKLIDPINKEIEKLSNEEDQLYNQIKEKYPNLSDQDIITTIHNRLEKEGL